LRPCLIDSALVADPNLQQVITYTVEAGLRGQFNVAQGLVNWTAGGFRANTNDIIAVSSPIPGHQFFQNAGNTLRQGIEANVTHKQDRWTLYANYTYVDATLQNALTLQSPFNPFADANGNIFVVPSDHLTGIPNFRFKLGGEYQVTKPWKVGADLNVVGSQWLVGDESNQNSKVPAYWVVNLHSSYKITDNVEVFGLVRNLFDQHCYVFGTFFDVTSFPYLGQTDPRTFVPGMPLAGYLGIRGTLPTIGPAFAADAAPPVVTKAAPVADVAAHGVNWTGIHLGLNGGFTFGGSRWADSVTCCSTGNFDTSGFVFGGTLGADYQLGRIVLGVEADGDWADASGSATFMASTLCAGGCRTTSTWLSTVRGRAGYAFDRFLVYSTVGAAFGGVRAIFTNNPTSAATEAGWTAGAGVEARWSEIGAPRRNICSSSSPTDHAPRTAQSPTPTAHPSFRTSPSESVKASSAAASIINSPGDPSAQRAGLAKAASFKTARLRSRRRAFLGGYAGQFEAQRPQLLPGLRIIGLGVGARLALAVEIEPALALELRRLRKLENRVGALFDAADRRDARLTHHGGVHIGRRMQRVDGDAGAGKLAREIEREQDLRELALAISARTAVAAREHHVVEVDHLLTERRHIDDAGRRTCFDQRQQQVREQKAGQIVHGENELMPVGAGQARGPCRAAAKPGIVDQELQARRRLPHRRRKPPDVGHGGQIGGQEFRVAAIGIELRHQALAARAIAAVHKNAPAAGGQPLRHHAADAVGRAGDKRRLFIRSRQA
jgi:hypothetical protein